jgi:hypothetical protein
MNELKLFFVVYVNHRPVFGITKTQIEKAFEVLQNFIKKEEISKKELENLLLNHGEKMNENELQKYFEKLGNNNNNNNSIIDAKIFAEDVLGLIDYE